ncbi:MAG: cell division protein FtsQ/DivIB [Tannerella sp.]|jgi:cell division protein FtsQ|nr:cell division protein FtsQ/DivIB [Tannerella sp.]
MKKIIFTIIATLLLAYIGFTIFYFARQKRADTVCKEVEIIIADSLKKHFLSESDIVAYLKNRNVYPLNRETGKINTDSIEKALMKNEIIEKAEVIQKNSGNIKIVVSQKMPILRVFTGGGNYFVDSSGKTMPTVPGQAIYVPVASGNIEKTFAVSQLYKFALFLQNDAFWNDQIEQIYVRNENEVEIIPRVGDQTIILGSLENFEQKLRKLRLFYEQVIPRMGWEKYSVINLRYKNQIVCTKKQ